MAKVDAQSDYYGMLGISPTAETDEIKKQFKKLGESTLQIQVHAAINK